MTAPTAARPAPTKSLRDADDAFLSYFIIRAHRDLVGHQGGTLLLTSAIENAVEAHRQQHRTDHRGIRQPYVLHPLRNTARLLMFGVTDLDLLIASLFHDTVEDVPEALVAALTGRYELAPVDALRAEYGDVVADTVERVTNPAEHARLPRIERNDAYIAHIVAEVLNAVRALLVKVVDFLDNAGGLRLLMATNPAMAKRLAAKYQPMVPLLDEALQNPAVAEFTPHVDLIRDEVRAVGADLDFILAA
ncbi:HD domain-containing protein [Curtobacterium sp. MCSS17_016]|uniref:HD domain-containing protein n=1 Tax=Curtobacterium sp. MCSS17_016 TaxID=2175644 RepID=UPI000DA9404B|nr:HD domain-containing protein [Curtobacterium sp. MCSS17_016]WIE81158.1 HD domain-containing protein [Curtobacterium sp. MCSS17_016]